MAVISFKVANSSVGNSATHSLSLSSSGGPPNVGDQMVLIHAFGTGALPVGTPTGWTQIGSDITNGSQTVRIFKKVATTADQTAVVSVTSALVTKYWMGYGSYSNSIGIGEVETNIDAAATLNHITTALTSMAVSGSWALCCFVERSATVPNPSWTAPGGMSTRTTLIGTGTSTEGGILVDTNAIVTTLAAKTAVSADATPVKGVNIAIELLAAASVVTPPAPTSISATAGDAQATVGFISAGNGGDPAVTFQATSSPGGLTSVHGTSSPLVVPGLTNGVTYTFTVKATNSAGTSAASGASLGVTPVSTTATFLQVGALPIIGGPFIPPPPNGPLLGVASPSSSGQGDATHTVTGDQEGWDITGGFMGLKTQRTYNSGLPGSYSATRAAKVTGPTRRIMSVTPNVALGLTGGLDATVAALAAGGPAGDYWTTNHEPEQKAKNILPVDYGNWFVRFMNIVKATNPAILVGPIVMTFTSNNRPVDGLGHATFGHNEWLEAVANAGGVPDFVGLDGYPDAATPVTSGQTEFGPPTAIAQGLWPGVRMVVAEIGFVPGAPRLSKIIDAYTYIKGTGLYDIFSYFDANQGVADYILEDSVEAPGYAGLQF